MTKFANNTSKLKLICAIAFSFALVLGMAFLSPTFAFAEEEAGGIGAILPNPIEFFPMLIAFIILCLILWKFGWPMFNGMLEKRENTIRQALEDSEKAKQEAEKTLEEYKKQLESARQESAEILSNARDNAEKVEAELREKAQASADEIVAKAKTQIEAEKKQAIADLQSSVADMSINVASKLVGNDLSDDEHRKIIEKYIVEAGSFNE